MVLFLCILVPQLMAAQVHPPLDPFSEAIGNDALWLEAYIEAVEGPGFWTQMPP